MAVARRWVKLGVAALVPLALFYPAVGLYTLTVDAGFSYPIDLRLRWVEHRFLARGLNPQVMGHPDPGVPEKHRAMRGAGGSYPPWSYATGALLVPPLDWRLTRVYFAGLNAVALGLVGVWAYRRGAAVGRAEAWYCVCALAAMFSTAVCLSYGQYSVLIFAMLVGCAALISAGRRLTAGLLLGLALVKPQLSGLFALALLVRGEFRVLAAAGIYIAAASGLTWAATGADPVLMIRATSKESELYGFLSQNHLSLLFQQWLGFRRGMLVLAGLGAALCVALTRALGRQAPLETVFSACAVVTMFWTYRKDYDVVLLGFTVLGLTLPALRTRSAWSLAVAVAFAGTLWLPIRGTAYHHPAVQVGLAAVWTAGLAVMVASERRGPSRPEGRDELAVDEK